MIDDDKDTIRLTSENPANREDLKGIKNPLGGMYDHVSFTDKEAIEKAKTQIKRKPGQITDQKEFEKIANEVFDKISKANNTDLVEIYKIRQELGDKVSRGDFNNLFKKMTEWGGDFQAIGGSLSSQAENDIGIRDSIPDGLSGHGHVNTYVKRLKE